MALQLSDEEKKMRDEWRSATLGSPSVVSSVIVEWNGKKHEIRRPTLRRQEAMRKLSKNKDGSEAIAKSIFLAIKETTFIPGTNIPVYEDADEEAILNRTDKDFVGVFMRALAQLNQDTNMEDISKNSESAQTE